MANLCTAPNCIFKESWVQDLLSSMKSEKTRTFTRRFYANFSTSRITSLLGCRPLEKNFPARTKKLSKIEVGDVKVVCTFDSIAQCMTFFFPPFVFRFVSISKNYRSVIRACMEELQQVAGENSEICWIFQVLVYRVSLIKWAVSLFYSFHKIPRTCNTIWKSGLSLSLSLSLYLSVVYWLLIKL